MPRAYGSLLIWQNRNSGGFFTASTRGWGARKTISCREGVPTLGVLPAGLVAFVLLVEPGFEGGEIVEDRGGVDFFFAGQRFQSFGPGAALSHFEHFRELRARSFVAVDGATVQRAGIARFAAERALKLELKHEGKEKARVGNVAGNVVFRAGIEIGFSAFHGWNDALVFAAEIPPGFVVFRRRNFPGEHFPAPFVDHQAERQKRDLFERAMKEQSNIG